MYLMYVDTYVRKYVGLDRSIVKLVGMDGFIVRQIHLLSARINKFNQLLLISTITYLLPTQTRRAYPNPTGISLSSLSPWRQRRRRRRNKFMRKRITISEAPALLSVHLACSCQPPNRVYGKNSFLTITQLPRHLERAGRRGYHELGQTYCYVRVRVWQVVNHGICIRNGIARINFK